MTVLEYIMEFKTYETSSGFNEVSLIQYFRRGLKSSILDDFRLLNPTPTTLQGWKNAARDNEQAFLFRKEEKALWNPSKPTPLRPNFPPQSQEPFWMFNLILSTPQKARRHLTGIQPAIGMPGRLVSRIPIPRGHLQAGSYNMRTTRGSAP